MSRSSNVTINDSRGIAAQDQGTAVGDGSVVGNTSSGRDIIYTDQGAIASSFGYGARALDAATASQNGALALVDKIVTSAFSYTSAEQRAAQAFSSDFGARAFDMATGASKTAAQSGGETMSKILQALLVAGAVVAVVLIAREVL